MAKIDVFWLFLGYNGLFLVKNENGPQG